MILVTYPIIIGNCLQTGQNPLYVHPLLATGVIDPEDQNKIQNQMAVEFIKSNQVNIIIILKMFHCFGLSYKILVLM